MAGSSGTMELFKTARTADIPVVHVTYDTRIETDPRSIHPTNRKRRQPDSKALQDQG